MKKKISQPDLIPTSRSIEKIITPGLNLPDVFPIISLLDGKTLGFGHLGPNYPSIYEITLLIAKDRLQDLLTLIPHPTLPIGLKIHESLPDPSPKMSFDPEMGF